MPRGDANGAIPLGYSVRDTIADAEQPGAAAHAYAIPTAGPSSVELDVREGVDVAVALRSALREDPDIVLIGELRDLETIESALRIAETGHLTFATLHTNSAVSTITPRQ